MIKTYAKQLQEISDFLTPRNWTKGSLIRNTAHFLPSLNKDELCFCAHGAAENLCNPLVKQALSYDEKSNVIKNNLGDAGWCALNQHGNLRDAWKNRKRSYYMFNETSTYNIHFIMGMFGITASFNDNLETTLEQLKQKFQEAINWARKNEEFLLNN